MPDIDRRVFIGGIVAAGAVGAAGVVRRATRGPRFPHLEFDLRPGIPGLYPGRVIEVAHAKSVTGGVRDRTVVNAMVARGMRELVGAEDAVDAWRALFKRGDRVGIKVVAAGKPVAMSSPEIVLEVIEGLKSAGVRTQAS